MAYGEQFIGNRQIVAGPDGGTGTRVFLVPWASRYSYAGPYAIPEHNAKWSVATDSRLDRDEELWVHSVVRDPYGASSAAGSKEAATECRVTVTYRGWPVNLLNSANWIISARQIVQATETGRELEFTTSKNKVPKRAGQIVSLIEFAIIGEVLLTDAPSPAANKECMTAIPGLSAQGTVCAEQCVMGDLQYVDNDTSKRGALLFEGQSLSAPYERSRIWYRKFERSILWRAVLETAGNPDLKRRVLGGHNLQYDASTSAWDTTDPPLYPTTKWLTGTRIVPDGVLS